MFRPSRAFVKRLLSAPLLATAAVAVSRFFSLPPLRDAATGAYLDEAHLAFSPAHLALTPFSTLADWLTCNSLRQDCVFLSWAALAWALYRISRRSKSLNKEARAAGVASLALLIFLLWTAFVPRSASRIEVDDPDTIVLDFHSHTARSWDGRRTFTLTASRLWHERSGYDAAFVTDHNILFAPPEKTEGEFPLLMGEEASLHEAHVLVLGNNREVHYKDYEGLPGLEKFLGEAEPVYGGLAVMSLPEYWQHHWTRLSKLVDAGTKGFEIVSAAPKALDFSSAERAEVVSLCRARNLFMTGGSDNHGYGNAACVWNFLQIPGWRLLDTRELQKAVIERLKAGGFGASRVVLRTHLDPVPGLAIWLDTPLALWIMLRAYTGAQCLAALAWIWGFAFFAKSL